MSELFDPGLQPERTALAWRRTALSLAAVMLAGLKLVWPLTGVWALAVTLPLVTVLLAVVLHTERRRERVHRGLTDANWAGDLPTDGRLPVAMAVGVSLCGLAGLVFVMLVDA